MLNLLLRVFLNYRQIFWIAAVPMIFAVMSLAVGIREAAPVAKPARGSAVRNSSQDNRRINPALRSP